MERTHGKLSSRLTDGLRRNDAYRFADLRHFPLSEVATIAHGANASGGAAGERRTNIHLFDTSVLDFDNLLFIDLGPHRDDDFAGNRVNYVVLGCTAQDA